MKRLITKRNKRDIIPILMILVPLVLFTPVQGWADDFGSALKAAMATFPPYPDIAGVGGAWAAIARLSSDNPASLSIFNEYQLKAVFYTNPNQIRLNRGRGVWAVNSGVLVPLADGCLKISHTSIDADRIHNKKFLGSNYEIDSKDVKVYYGRKINDKIALGLLFKPWSSTEVKLKFPGADLGKSEGKARFNIRPGFLYQPIKNWYLGLTYEYADERIKTTIFNPITFAKVKTTEDSYTRIWRMGGSFEPKQGTLLALDWQVGEIDGPERGDYNIDMFFFGIEQHIHQNMALRMGSLDGSITAGIGISYKNMHLDYSYIKESLKDLNPHCGSSKTHAVAISLTF